MLINKLFIEKHSYLLKQEKKGIKKLTVKRH